MKRARIAHRGRELWCEVVADDMELRLPDGAVMAADDAHWLPPVGPGATVFALGLNLPTTTGNWVLRRSSKRRWCS